MGFGNDSTTANNALKEYYNDDNVEVSLFEDHTFLGVVPKQEDCTGKYFVEDVVIGAGQALGPDFTVDQSHAALSGEVIQQFQVTLVSNHVVANIDADLIERTGNDRGAFMNMVTQIADDQLSNFMNEVAISLYRTSDASRGQIDASTTLASSTLVLTNVKDALNFEVGMQLDVAAAQSSGNVRAYGTGQHGLYVSGIDYDLGTLTTGILPQAGATACNITDATNGIPTAAAGDFIYRRGSRNKYMNGLGDWLPQTVASNDSFNHVNRSINRVRLAGHFIDRTSGTNICSTLEDAGAIVSQQGGKLTHFFMDHLRFANLSKELGAKAVLVDAMSTNAKVGYTGIKVAMGKGSAIVLPDTHCPPDRIYGVNMAKWKLRSIGKICHIWQRDGMVWLRSSSSAGQEIRMYSIGNMSTSSPRDNIAIKVPVAA
jgi:hypothetical protein